MASRIQRVGVELEGAWLKPPSSDEAKRITHGYNFNDSEAPALAPFYMKGDGSVSMNCSPEGGIEDGGLTTHWNRHHCHTGEIISPPLPLNRIAPWTDLIYPSCVNQSCGFHIHLSTTTPLHYSRLMDRSFVAFIIERFTEWGKVKEIYRKSPFWDRLKGQNSYARNLHMPDEQVHRGGERYTQFNYPYSRHQTLELRFLPMFKQKEIALDALTTYLDAVEEYLQSKYIPTVISGLVPDSDPDNPTRPIIEHKLPVILTGAPVKKARKRRIA